MGLRTVFEDDDFSAKNETVDMCSMQNHNVHSAQESVSFGCVLSVLLLGHDIELWVLM
jgi:hypothetical protein